jgi:hypothetical protein
MAATILYPALGEPEVGPRTEPDKHSYEAGARNAVAPSMANIGSGRYVAAVEQPPDDRRWLVGSHEAVKSNE